MTKRSTPSFPLSPANPHAKPGGAWKIPQPGDVLSYAYLWAREARSGQEEGLKDRPVVVVLASVEADDGLRLIVVPVTHSAPDMPDDAVEMPRNVKRDLGLDSERSWIVVTECNRFLWPGPDVRPLAHGSPFHGAIPDWLFLQARQSIAAIAGRGKMRITPRTE